MPRNYTDQSKIDTDFNWLNNDVENQANYSTICNRELSEISAQAKLSLPPGYRLVLSQSDTTHFQIALLCDTSKEIVYFIKCAVWEDISFNAKPVTQILLWRTSVVSHRKVTSGIAESIFRDYLLKKYNIVASDSCQTREGRDFWVRQLGYALEFGEYVYRFDRLSCELVQLNDHGKIRDNSCDLWGDGAAYENILAVISIDQLRHLPKE